MPDLWSVSELNRYVKQSLEMDYRLQDLRVTGEVSGFRAYPSGHWYFTLKDGGAQVSCVMWRGRAERQRFTPRDGDAVIAAGSITLYEVRGQYQLDVALLLPTGEGVLFQEFLRLRARLEAEGLFAPERKRPLPAWPARIAVVTSPAGAALRDILNIIRRRWPLVEVIIAPTPVQGLDAPPQIVAALKAAAAQQPDVIILARGGGALEDLWSFNDERVARAIAASPAPVVSGVGHETDFTIADFAADRRAPTPTAAAELVSPARSELLARIAECARCVAREMRRKLHYAAQAVDSPARRLVHPAARLRAHRELVTQLGARLAFAFSHRVHRCQAHLARLNATLVSLDPTAVLARGYSITYDAAGAVLRDAANVKEGERLRTRLARGELESEVKKKPNL